MCLIDHFINTKEVSSFQLNFFFFFGVFYLKIIWKNIFEWRAIAVDFLTFFVCFLDNQRRHKRTHAHFTIYDCGENSERREKKKREPNTKKKRQKRNRKKGEATKTKALFDLRPCRRRSSRSADTSNASYETSAHTNNPTSQTHTQRKTVVDFVVVFLFRSFGHHFCVVNALRCDRTRRMTSFLTQEKKTKFEIIFFLWKMIKRKQNYFVLFFVQTFFFCRSKFIAC